jgi:16S rRNA (adenine1518-N6/adenine1519-N6)-dimethyltransferase
MRAKRSLGQNFLRNPVIAERMAAFAHITSKDTVLEVGPGRGMLTRVLLRHASRVIAIEKDDQLFDLLLKTFRDRDTIQLIHEDILACDLSQLIQDGTKIVANLPYNIATQLIMRLAEYSRCISSIVVMLQKEVAQRLCAHTGEKAYSALSVIVSAGFDAISGFKVSPDNFIPRPKVDSQVIKLIPKASPIPVDDMEMFRQVVWCSFSKRRKVLRNSLIQLPRMDQGHLEIIAEKAGISLRSRPQEITPEQFHLLSQAYRQLMVGMTPGMSPR